MENKKSITIVGCVGVPARYGGFETLAEQLSKALSPYFNIYIYCSSKAYGKNERNTPWKNINRVFIPLKANGYQSILFDTIAITKAFKISDIVLLLGGSAGLSLPIVKLFFRGKKLVFHPDGIEWKRKKWNIISRFFLYISVKTACKVSDKIIIDNRALLQLYSKYPDKLAYCAYGGNQHNTHSPIHKKKNYWLTIARAEPENNLQLIAESFKRSPNQKWVIISNYTNTKHGKFLYNAYKNCKNIIFVDSVYSNKDLEEYYSLCKGYIHGHSSGGTNPTLTAAMWLNKPLICHDNIFNRETTQGKALFFHTARELVRLIEKNHQPHSKLTNEALHLAIEEYNWTKISDAYKKIFDTL